MVGASPLPKAVRERFESATGVPLLEGYGLTEATCASARSFVDHPVPGSVGQRLPYQQVKTVEVTAEGGWVDLPRGHLLDLYGFQLDITKLGFGRADDGGRWIGLSGSVKLVL